MDLLGADISRIKSVLDMATKQQELIQQNLANVNTAGYKSRTLQFDEALNEYIVVEREGLNPRQDGNTVVLEVENADARKTALWYRLHLQAMSHEARMVRSAISGRGQ